MSSEQVTARIGKNIINTHLNLQNVMDLKDEDNRRIFIDTLDIIKNLLTPHCGPYSQYGMIVDQNVIASGNGNLASPNTFSKDGIELLEHVEFASIIQIYLKNVITYIGREVDRRAKDGTTTAMLVATSFLKNCILNKEIINGLKLTTFEQNIMYKKFIKLIFDEIENAAFSIDKLSTVHENTDEQYWAGVIAFMQAMSSSGGNIELANCMKTIFSTIPKEAWEHQTWFNSNLENDKDYSIYIEPHDFSLEVDFQTMNIYNEEMHTEWVEKDVEVLAIPDGMTSNDVCVSEISNYIKNYPKDKSFCIVSANVVPEILQLIGMENVTREKPIAFATYNSKKKQISQYALDVAILCAVASVQPYAGNERKNPLSKKHTFMVDKIRSHGSIMEFFGLFDHEPGIPTIHPNYSGLTHCKFYDDLLKDLKDRANIANVALAKDLTMYEIATTGIKDMICFHMPTLQIGGNTHDHVAAKRVVQDVIGATMASITHHFFINGILTMKKVLENVKNTIFGSGDTRSLKENDYIHYMYLYFEDAINYVINILYDLEHSDSNNMIPDMQSLKPEEYINVLSPNGVKGDLDIFLEYLTIGDSTDTSVCLNYPVIQPVLIYHEILNRVGELIIKLMATDKVIIPGGVYVTKSST